MSLKFNRYSSALNFFLVIFLGLCYLGYDYLELPSFLMPLGRLHPLLLHLPIGLWIGSLLLFFLLPENEMAIKIMMVSSVTTALLSAIVGLFLSKESGYNPEDLAWHRHTGTLFAFCAYMSITRMVENIRTVKLALMGIATLLLIIAGHLGAEITHGNDFLLPKTSGQNEMVVCNEDSAIYTSLVRPILEEKCISCHNPRKAKNDFMMSDTLSFLKGGESGKTIIDKQNTQESYLLQVIQLPANAEKHMPPKGKKQLTQEEMEVIESWLELGAPFTTKVNTLPNEHMLRTICQDRSETSSENYDFPPVSANLLEEINTDFLTVQPIAANSPALSAVFFVASAFSSQAFANLNKVKDQLVSLDLSYMPLTEKDWRSLSNYQQLEKLKLNSSTITDEHLQILTKLPNLRSLAIHETAVSEKLGDYLDLMPGLQKLYLGKTLIAESIIQDWQNRYSNVKIQYLEPDNEIIPLSPPTIIHTKGIHDPDDRIVLDNVINGVSFRYTLDGSEPDSLNGFIYNGPIPIQKINNLKTVAIKEGWLTSEVNQSLYFGAGFKPDSALLLFPPNPRYPGEGVKTLIDYENGDIKVLKDKTWIAFRQQPLLADFLFQKDQIISSIVVSYGIDVFNYLIPPTSVKVYGGDNIDNLKLLYSMTSPAIKPEQKNDLYKTHIEINFEPKKYKIIRIEGHNLKKLPPWHRGSGKESWFHVDEIYFYE